MAVGCPHSLACPLVPQLRLPAIALPLPTGGSMAWGLLAPLLYFVDSFWGPSPQVLLVPGSGHHQCQACPHGEAHGSGAGLFLRTNSTMWPPHTGSWALPSSLVRAGANADCSWVSFDSFLLDRRILSWRRETAFQMSRKGATRKQLKNCYK